LMGPFLTIRTNAIVATTIMISVAAILILRVFDPIKTRGTSTGFIIRYRA